MTSSKSLPISAPLTKCRYQDFPCYCCEAQIYTNVFCTSKDYVVFVGRSSCRMERKDHGPEVRLSWAPTSLWPQANLTRPVSKPSKIQSPLPTVSYLHFLFCTVRKLKYMIQGHPPPYLFQLSQATSTHSTHTHKYSSPLWGYPYLAHSLHN